MKEGDVRPYNIPKQDRVTMCSSYLRPSYNCLSSIFTSLLHVHCCFCHCLLQLFSCFWTCTLHASLSLLPAALMRWTSFLLSSLFCLSYYIMQEFTSIFLSPIPFSAKTLVLSSLAQFSHLPTTLILLREEYHEFIIITIVTTIANLCYLIARQRLFPASSTSVCRLLVYSRPFPTSST